MNKKTMHSRKTSRAPGRDKRSSMKAKVDSAAQSMDLRTASLGDQAYRRLRLEILTLEFEPGERVSEGILATRYRMGRSPIRAALQRLVQDELVINQGHRGTFIAPLTLQDVADIFAMRRLIVPEMARLAAGRIPAKQLKSLQVSRESLTYDRTDHASLVRFLLQNRDFNMTIASASDNKRLARAMEDLEDLTLRGLYLAFRHTDLLGPYREATNELYDALAKGEGIRAREIALRELDWAERVVLEAIMRLPGMRSTNVYKR